MTTAAATFPPQIKYIVGNEACERFSFYGMRAILTVFMVSSLLMQKHEATTVYHLFVSACYLTPLLGAWISDRFWGKYKTILYLSLGYCLGHGILAMFESKAGLYTGLFFIAGSLAAFIRKLGYHAIPCGNNVALSIPLAVEAGLGSEALARLQADCAGLVRDLFARCPEGALVLLRVLRRPGGVGLEVTAQYAATPLEPLGGRLTVNAWEPAG